MSVALAPNSYAALGRSIPLLAADAYSFEAAAPAPKSQIKNRQSQIPSDLDAVLRPQAYERWLMPQLKNITPTYIEQVLRGAVVGNHIMAWALFDMMEDTWPRLAKAMKEIKQSAIALEWKLNPWAEEDTPPTDSALEKTRLVSAALWKMRPDPAADEDAFSQTIFNCLDAMGKGLSVQEVLWHTRQAGSLGEIIAPRCTCWVRPMNYAWGPEGRLGLNSQILENQNTNPDPRTTPYAPRAYNPTAQLSTGNSNVIDFPEDKFLISIFKAKTGHPLGGALLRSLAWWWCGANFSAAWLLNLGQIFGLPMRWATYDPNLTPSDKLVLQNMLQNMGSAAWAMFPQGTTFELKESSKGAENSPQDSLLERADQNCDLLILGQTLTTSQGQRGSQSLGEVHQVVRQENVMAAAGLAAEVFNRQLIPSILRLNYGDEEEAPEIIPTPDKQKDQLDFASRDAILLKSGVKMPKKWFYKRYDIPLPAPGEEVVEAPLGSPLSPIGGEGQGEGASDKPDAPDKPTLTAKDAREKLTDNVMEDLAGTEAKWLGGVRPYFVRLIAIAQSRNVSDGELLTALEGAKKHLPELFHHLDTKALALSMEKAMGAAVVNGALKGAMARRTA